MGKKQESLPHTENIQNAWELDSSFQAVTTLCHYCIIKVFHLTNWCSASTFLNDVHMMWKHFCCYDLKISWQICTWVRQTGFLTLNWLGPPSLSQSPVHNPRPEWFLYSGAPFVFVQLSVLNLFQRGDPKALSSGGGREHCMVCSSLQTYFSSLSFDDCLIPMGPDLKTVLDLAESSGPGSLLSSQHTPTFKP